MLKFRAQQFEGFRGIKNLPAPLASDDLQLHAAAEFDWLPLGSCCNAQLPDLSKSIGLLRPPDGSDNSESACIFEHQVGSLNFEQQLDSLTFKYQIRTTVGSSLGRQFQTSNGQLAPGRQHQAYEQRLARSWSAAASANLSQVCRLNSILCRFQVKHLRSQTPRPPLLAKRDADEAPSWKFGSDLLLRS